MGKIKLTNAELIKALLLKKDNYKGESEKEITASQIKISTAWDNMEATLQREDMWRFLTGSGKFSSIDTHMELIFQIMAKEIIKSRVEKYPEFYVENEEQLNRETYTFIIFNREMEYMKREYVAAGDYKYSKMLEDFWGKVESFCNMFIDWYFNLLSGNADDDCPLYFYFLDLGEYNLGDSIYIKLNARGKDLTCYENFKAKFRYIEGYSKRLKIGLGFGTTSGKVEIHAMRFAYMRDTEEQLLYC